MERLLKLAQNRPNSFDYTHQNEGIFDIKTYQKAIDRLACSSSMGQISNSKNKRISISQTVNKYANSSLFQGNLMHLKQEIRPHQAKQIVSRITEIIKTKKQASKFLSSPNNNSQRIHPNTGNQKKASYSAYINARKKIFQKQNPIPYSTNHNSEPKTSNPHKNFVFDDQDLNRDSLAPDFINQQFNSQAEGRCNNLNTYMNSTMNKYQRFRLEGIVTQKKIQAKRRSEVQKTDEANNPIMRPRNFITVIKKRSNQSHLMVHNTKQVSSQRKIQQKDEVVDSYIKNFAHQTRFQEEQIEMFPSVTSILKLGKTPQNCYQIQEMNSKSVTILHYSEGQVKSIFNLCEKERVQIASITKVMTSYLVLTISQKFCIDIKKQKIIVSQRASKMPGTSAKLAYSDVLTIYEALHALMLPSGNDAAMALGQWGGKQIRKYSSLLRRLHVPNQDDSGQKSANFLSTLSLKKKSHLRLFIHHMNKLAKFLHLNSTHFVNTHGLMNEKAYSCSQNISLLTYYTMSNPVFRQIVGKKFFSCKVFNRTFSHTKDVTWQNTNKLLGIQGFLGVKTGITPSAGPCLTSFFQISSSEYFIITILKTKSCEMRFKQTINILKTTLLHLLDKTPYNLAYKNSITNLEGYNRTDFKQEEKQFENNCRQSTQSHQSIQDQDDDDFNETRMNFI